MNTGRYTVKNLLSHHDMHQFIVPEIQRDYVWGKENVLALLTSLNEDAQQQTSITKEELEQLPEKLRELTLRGYEQKKQYTNIGFIYAYYDSSYLNKYFLIDGQQRMTTLFLIMLALASKNEESKKAFEKTYFAKSSPKVNYKVREAAQSFLAQFIPYILEGKDVQEVENCYWYFTDYQNDPTIQSIISNYKVIEAFISESSCVLNFDYIENFTELWYFDTNKSAQGESLYIYMNSRGKAVEFNEKIKASLLEGLSEEDKAKWGSQWEEWQDYFWKNRGENKNADQGFNEFLKWVIIINYITKEEAEHLNDQEKFIKEVRSSSKVDFKYLLKEDVASYIQGLKKLYETDIRYADTKWLTGVRDKADYIRLLPVLMLMKKYPEAEEKEVERFARFFYNLPRLAHIRRNPDTYCVQAIRLTEAFLAEEYRDVTDLIHYEKNEEFKGILTPEEKFKLRLYAQPPGGFNREALEQLFWEAEDYSLFHGQISYLFFCMGIVLENSNSVAAFSWKSFEQMYHHLVELLGNPVGADDLLRRALLTYGDYSMTDGSTPKLGGTRWSFINRTESWRSLIQDKERKEYLKSLLLAYSKEKQANKSREDILLGMIENYNTTHSTSDSWIDLFIAEPRILAYCNSKNVCFSGENLEDIYLLFDTKAMDGSFVNLLEFVEELERDTQVELTD